MEKTDALEVPPGTGENAIDGVLQSPDKPIASATIFPDGGMLAWVQVLSGFLLMFSSWGLITSFGVFQTFYGQSPALSTPSLISWIGSVQTCLVLFCGAFSGRFMDAGYAQSMSIVGSFLIVLGICCSSISGGNQIESGSNKENLVYWQILLSQGVCEGLGMGLIFLPSMGIPATYFVKNRALAMGIVTSGASIGGILYPIIFEQLLGQIGFRWACRVVGLVALITLGLACTVMKQRTDLPRKAKGPLLEIRAMKEPVYLLLVAAMALSFSGVYILYYYIQSRIAAAGVDLHGLKSYYLVTLLNVGGLFGRILPGILADQRGPLFIHATVILVTGILLFVWPFVLNEPGLIVLAIIYGFFSGGFTSLPPASVASISPDMSRFGARFGMAVTMNGFGVLAGPPIAGAIIGDGSGYVRAGVFGGVTTFVGGLGLVVTGTRSPGALEKFRRGFAEIR